LEASATHVVHEENDVALSPELLGNSLVEFSRTNWCEAAAPGNEGHGRIWPSAGRPEDTIAIIWSLGEARRGPERQHTERRNSTQRGRILLIRALCREEMCTRTLRSTAGEAGPLKRFVIRLVIE
jgi:hypothetical protein